MAYNFSGSVQRMHNNMNVEGFDEDPRNSVQLINSSMKLRTATKAWGVGDKCTFLYPFVCYLDRDSSGNPMADNACHFFLRTAAIYGFDADYKQVGMSFISTRMAIDSDMRPIGTPDITYQFSFLAPLLVKAEMEEQLDALKKQNWDILGESAYRNARQKIEDQYDRSKNMNAKRPAVGRLKLKLITETAVIRHNLNGASEQPELEAKAKDKSSGVYLQAVSNNRREKLTTLANDPLYGIKAQNPGVVFEDGSVYFLEVMYNFTSASGNVAEAGRADPQGVAYTVSLRQRFPECAAGVQDMLNRVSKTAADIKSHSWDYSEPEQNMLKQKFQTIMTTSARSLGYLLPEDQERLLKQAEVIDTLRVRPSDEALNAKIEEQLGHAIGAGTSGAPTAAELLAQGTAAQASAQDAVDAALRDGTLGSLGVEIDSSELEEAPRDPTAGQGSGIQLY